MPTYEYLCDNCGLTFTRHLPIKDYDKPTEEACELCTRGPIVRLCGNKGGFRLGTKGTVSWAKGGYNTHLGDIVNSEAR